MNIVKTNCSILRAHIKHHGWTRTILKVIDRVASRYLGIHVYMVRVRPMEGSPDNPCTLPDITFRSIGSAELLDAADKSELGLSREFVKAAIERGDLAFGGFDGSRLVTYVWRSSTSAPHEDRMWVRVGRPYNYSYKTFTEPSYRGHHLAPAALLFADAQMFQLGYTHRAGFVSLSNFSSVATGKYMETKPIGYAGYLDWFGQHIPFSTKAVKSIGFEFFVPERSN